MSAVSSTSDYPNAWTVSIIYKFLLIDICMSSSLISHIILYQFLINSFKLFLLMILDYNFTPSLISLEQTKFYFFV